MDRKKFQRLQREWYGKLAKSGFVDIEKGDQLIAWSSRWMNQERYGYRPTELQEREQYYQLANDFLVEWGELFMSELERAIWELYCEGMGCRKIAAALKAKGTQTNKDYVHWAIRDLKQIMFTVMNVG